MAWVASNKVVNTTKAAAQATATKGAMPRSRSPLSMYVDVPTGEIALEEFERFALDRLKGAAPCRRALRPPSAAAQVLPPRPKNQRRRSPCAAPISSNSPLPSVALPPSSSAQCCAGSRT